MSNRPRSEEKTAILIETDNAGFPVRLVRVQNAVEAEYCLEQSVKGGDTPRQSIFLTGKAARKLGLLRDGAIEPKGEKLMTLTEFVRSVSNLPLGLEVWMSTDAEGNAFRRFSEATVQLMDLRGEIYDLDEPDIAGLKTEKVIVLWPEHD